MTPDLRDALTLTLTHADAAFRLARDIFRDAAAQFIVADADLAVTLDAPDDPDHDFHAACLRTLAVVSAARDKRDAAEAALSESREVYCQINGIRADLTSLLADAEEALHPLTPTP